MAASSRDNELRHLPKLTQSKLRSTQIIVSLPQLVSELVQNSLDAGAGQVDVGVDCEEWSCWVRDDGKGMNKQDLKALESAGRYGTSKACSAESLGEVSTFGFRGEALVSIADLSCLEISSRTSRSRESWSIILKSGKNLYNGPAVRWRRESQGTVVCIRDAFYNLPIRRLSHTSVTRTLELIRKELEALALVLPHVSFSLENTHKSASTRPEIGRIVKIPKTLSTLQAFRHIFGRALVDHVEEIDDTRDDLRINGFISLNATASKSHQYLYINRHPLSPCDLHRAIDFEFSSSSFGRQALDEYNQLSRTLPAVRHSPRKTEKKPVYVLNITIPPRQVDNCIEPSKTAVQLQNNTTVATFLSTVVQSFLVKHGFKAQPSNQGVSTQLHAARKKRKIDDGLSRDTSVPGKHGCNALPMATPRFLEETCDKNEPAVMWTDPTTGVSFSLNRRTGNSYPVDTPGGSNRADGRRTPSRSIMPSETVEPEEDTPSWIQQALGANQAYLLKESKIPSLNVLGSFNDAPSSQQHPQRNTYQSQANILSHAQSQLARFSKSDLQDAVVLGQVDQKFLACVLPVEPSSRLSQDEESSSSDEDDGGILVLIDQHAADERIRVERFMRELCTGFTPQPALRKLDPPVRVLLTKREADMLDTSDNIKEAFSKWGIQIRSFGIAYQGEEIVSTFFAGRDSHVSEDAGYAQIEVLTVPDVVAEKLLTENRLRDLIKSYLINLADPHFVSAILSYVPSQAKEEVMWQRATQWCPQDLIELANSKACRGAIMFNDPLSKERCERLVEELCDTALPFQCAHGRPSLVPLTSVKGDLACGVDKSRHLRALEWARFGCEELPM